MSVERNLLENNFTCRVSSVLQRDVKQFGKNYMFDGKEDTCWNSDQGQPQFILLRFEQPVLPSTLRIQFQGGFAGKESWLEGAESNESPLVKAHDIFPEDTNQEQIFKLSFPKAITALKLVFNNSTDFFGRIIVYKLALLGSA